MQKTLLIEALSVGVIVVIIGMIINSCMEKVKIERTKKQVLALFISGVVTHIICEYAGLNKWYCKNGNACKK
jgi:hypothetical protein